LMAHGLFSAVPGRELISLARGVRAISRRESRALSC
jgi:hypothetical protein